jgi:SAM-dependent methyltransferase
VLQERSSAYGASHPFDLVCAFEVLEHAEDDLEAVSEWSRFLHPGGWLLVSVPAFASRWGPFDVIVGHHRRYEPEGIMRLFLAAGLHRPRVELYGFPLGYVLEAARDGLAKVTKQADREAATARSGRLFQPPESLAWVMKAGTEPFRRLQRTSFGKRHGTGLIALGQRPPS